MTKTLLLLATILLLASFCYAQDLNIMTSEELQEYISQQIADQPSQPTVITIQADQQLNDKLDVLTSEMISMKEEMSKMQERFNRLALDTDESIQRGNRLVEQHIIEATQKQMDAGVLWLADRINEKTNPVRQNAPAIGVFLILTGAFLLWASKQYKLTNGGKYNA